MSLSLPEIMQPPTLKFMKTWKTTHTRSFSHILILVSIIFIWFLGLLYLLIEIWADGSIEYFRRCYPCSQNQVLRGERKKTILNVRITNNLNYYDVVRRCNLFMIIWRWCLERWEVRWWTLSTLVRKKLINLIFIIFIFHCQCWSQFLSFLNFLQFFAILSKIDSQGDMRESKEGENGSTTNNNMNEGGEEDGDDSSSDDEGGGEDGVCDLLFFNLII